METTVPNQATFTYAERERAGNAAEQRFLASGNPLWRLLAISLREMKPGDVMRVTFHESDGSITWGLRDEPILTPSA